MSNAPAREKRTAETQGLKFIPPETLRMGNSEQRVGIIVYRLLQTLFELEAHEVEVETLELEVWGKIVNRNTLCSACRRARNALINLQHPLRIAVDGHRVVLL